MVQVKVSTLVTWGALLVLAQLLISQWTVKAAGNRDVLDYISFAGTVVGMLLALLAIVYAFLTNASQRSDAESIRAQVSSLNDAIGRANASGSRFAEELGRLEEIRQSISITAANSDAALRASERIEERVGSLMRIQEKPADVSDVVVPAAVDTTAFLTLLASKALPNQVINYYLAAVQQRDGRDAASQLKEQLVFTTIKEAQQGWARNYFNGEIQGYYWIFYDLKPTKSEYRSFFDSLKRRIEGMSEDAYAEDNVVTVDALKNSLAIVKSRIEDELRD